MTNPAPLAPAQLFLSLSESLNASQQLELAEYLHAQHPIDWMALRGQEQEPWLYRLLRTRLLDDSTSHGRVPLHFTPDHLNRWAQLCGPELWSQTPETSGRSLWPPRTFTEMLVHRLTHPQGHWYLNDHIDMHAWLQCMPRSSLQNLRYRGPAEREGQGVAMLARDLLAYGQSDAFDALDPLGLTLSTTFDDTPTAEFIQTPAQWDTYLQRNGDASLSVKNGQGQSVPLWQYLWQRPTASEALKAHVHAWAQVHRPEALDHSERAGYWLRLERANGPDEKYRSLTARPDWASMTNAHGQTPVMLLASRQKPSVLKRIGQTKAGLAAMRATDAQGRGLWAYALVQGREWAERVPELKGLLAQATLACDRNGHGVLFQAQAVTQSSTEAQRIGFYRATAELAKLPGATPEAFWGATPEAQRALGQWLLEEVDWTDTLSPLPKSLVALHQAAPLDSMESNLAAVLALVAMKENAPESQVSALLAHVTEPLAGGWPDHAARQWSDAIRDRVTDRIQAHQNARLLETELATAATPTARRPRM